MFRRKLNVQTAHADHERAADAYCSSADLVEALNALRECRDLDMLDALPGEVAGALRDLRDSLCGRNETALRQTVDFSVQASRAMAATARITGEIRETDMRANAMAAGVDELTASIEQISETAHNVANAMEGVHGALQSGEQATQETAASNRKIGISMEQMNEGAVQLAEAAEQIGAFVATIDGLAQQTNLLALNATIEAARAGEAGKGFAVVASEVKVLSGQTQKATDDIRDRIERLQAYVKDVVSSVEDVHNLVTVSAEHSEQAAREISEVLGDIGTSSGHMSEIAGLLEGQSAAVQEIAEGMHAIAAHSKTANAYTEEVITAVGGSEAIIAEQFAHLEQFEIPNYVLHRAKSDHLLWKKHLSEMLVGINALKADELSDHHQCRLGKWYNSVKGTEIAKNPAFAALLPVHEEVHTLGKLAAQLYEKGDQEGAIDAARRMEEASEDVLLKLDALIG